MKSKLSQKALWGPIALLVLLICAGYYFGSAVKLRDELALSPISPRNRTVEVGGIYRPESDVLQRPKDDRSTDDDEMNSDEFNYGTTKLLEPTTNTAVQLAYTTISSSEKPNPERTGPMLAAPAFDEVAYQANPEAYLAESVPGRVWQTAQPGPGVPVMQRVSSRSPELKQGESVRLQTRTKPNAPVTYTSFDLGAFDNQLSSITVAANDEGIAEATFNATPGTVATVNIRASSPMASGSTQFEVIVTAVNLAQR